MIWNESYVPILVERLQILFCRALQKSIISLFHFKYQHGTWNSLSQNFCPGSFMLLIFIRKIVTSFHEFFLWSPSMPHYMLWFRSSFCRHKFRCLLMYPEFMVTIQKMPMGGCPYVASLDCSICFYVPEAYQRIHVIFLVKCFCYMARMHDMEP